jgi:pumilio family protein 6
LDQRKASKPHAALLQDAKRVWSLARKKNIGSERKKHITDLMNIVRGHVKDIVFRHDASRIIQTIVRWGGPAERSEIAVELKDSYKDLSVSKYSKVRSHTFKPSQHRT